MNRADRVRWMICGGVVSAIGFSVLAFAWIAFARWFIPRSTHMTWRESPILLIMTVPCGFMIGGYAAYHLAPMPKSERIKGFKISLLFAVIFIVWNVVLHGIWVKPLANQNFGANLLWDMGPLLIAVGLLKLLSMRQKI